MLTRTMPPPTDLEQLLSVAHEDLARLTQILHSLQCSVLMLGVDGKVLPRSSEPPAWSAIAVARGPEVRAPIHDPDGRVVVWLEVLRGAADCPDSARKLLRAVIEGTARSITERWFRLAYRQHWVMAVTRRVAPGTGLLLALDREKRVVGADFQARRLLETQHIPFEPCLALEALFHLDAGNLQQQSCCDAAVTLVTRSGEAWIGLVTPPDVGVIESSLDQRAVLHSRPRLDSVAHWWSASENRQQRGLSRAAVKRVQQYIDAHLDSSLDAGELAGIVGMSVSYFQHSFRKAVGVTPHRYVVQCRVKRARELLATTQLPLTEVALTVGFSDQSHFSRRFHELAGVPPGTFRGAAGRMAG
jgi:AraC-like DNA-binding protein